MADNKLYEKLRIAFKYGLKVAENHPEDSDCDDVYFDRSIKVINRVFGKSEQKYDRKPIHE